MRIDRVFRLPTLALLLGACAPDIELQYDDPPDTTPVPANTNAETPKVEPVISELVMDTSVPPLDTAEPEDDPPENADPVCGISTPADGASFSNGEAVFFEVDIDDDDDEQRVVWSSDSYGPMVLGNGFTFILPSGTHRVRVEVTDPEGAGCADLVEIHVLADDAP